ncbi:hypothetical protein [Alteromonas sp. S015]|uniref:hypothetical protein n=1 Tax=Alteromonas sp. S015 TaxID=3117401 RepID=UPI002FE00D87
MTAVITFNDIPAQNHMFKYERLGQMALENRRLYCNRHGYTFISEVEIARDRPACWAKIPAILKAFEKHDWVLWADSDTLIFDHSRRIEDFFNAKFDLIVQSHDHYYELMGLDPTVGYEMMPINTGVFLIRNTTWSKWLLAEAYKQQQFICYNKIWNGIGEQEAMIAVLQQHPDGLKKVGYVENLQNHPKYYQSGDMFVHFYGSYSRHYIPMDECEKVLTKWENANATGSTFPDDIERFHWCSIQTKQPDSSMERDDLDTYLYTPEDIGIISS